MEQFLPFVAMFLAIIFVLLVMREMRKPASGPPPHLARLAGALENVSFGDRLEIYLSGKRQGREVRVIPRPGRMMLPGVLCIQSVTRVNATIVMFRRDRLSSEFKKSSQLEALETGVKAFDEPRVIRTDRKAPVQRWLANEEVRNRIQAIEAAGYVWLEVREKVMTAKKLKYQEQDLSPTLAVLVIDHLIWLTDALENAAEGS